MWVRRDGRRPALGRLTRRSTKSSISALRWYRLPRTMMTGAIKPTCCGSARQWGALITDMPPGMAGASPRPLALKQAFTPATTRWLRSRRISNRGPSPRARMRLAKYARRSRGRPCLGTAALCADRLGEINSSSSRLPSRSIGRPSPALLGGGLPPFCGSTVHAAVGSAPILARPDEIFRPLGPAPRFGVDFERRGSATSAH